MAGFMGFCQAMCSTCLNVKRGLWLGAAHQLQPAEMLELKCAEEESHGCACPHASKAVHAWVYHQGTEGVKLSTFPRDRPMQGHPCTDLCHPVQHTPAMHAHGHPLPPPRTQAYTLRFWEQEGKVWMTNGLPSGSPGHRRVTLLPICDE